MAMAMANANPAAVNPNPLPPNANPPRSYLEVVLVGIQHQDPKDVLAHARAREADKEIQRYAQSSCDAAQRKRGLLTPFR